MSTYSIPRVTGYPVPATSSKLDSEPIRTQISNIVIALEGGNLATGNVDTSEVATLGTANTWTAAQTFNDSVAITLGTGADATLQFNGTNTVLASAAQIVMTPTTDTIFSNGTGVVIGHTAQIVGQPSASAIEAEILGTDASDSSLLLGCFSTTNTTQPFMTFVKSGNASIGGNTIVEDGERCGTINWSVDDGTDYRSEMAAIRAEVDGTPGVDDTPGRLIFGTTADGAKNFTERMRIDSAGKVYVNDSANTNMTVGLTLNQGANDDEILALKSSDVAHGMTDVAETDTYGDVVKRQATSGGLALRGFKDADGAAGYAVDIRGYLGEAADTSDTGGSAAVVHVSGFVKSGTSTASVANGGNLFAVENNGSVKMLIKGNGDGHIVNTTWTALDEEEDIGLVRAFQKEQSNGTGLMMSKWDEQVRVNAEDLKRVGVLSSEGDFINMQRMYSLQGGAIWQLYTKLQNALEKLEEATGLKLIEEAA